MEQFVRDARITQIYEGTNGIQAMDLVGRKLPKDGGRAIQAFFRLLSSEFAELSNVESLKPLLGEFSEAIGHLQAATQWLAQNGMADPDNAGAGAYPYMDLMGLVSLAWMWLQMAAASTRALESGTSERAFHEAKLNTARFFIERELPLAAALRRKIEAGKPGDKSGPATTRFSPRLLATSTA